MSDEWVIKLKAGKYVVPVTIRREKNRLWLRFRYNKKLLAEIKLMEGARWHGYDEPNPRKMWSIPDSARNRFTLEYLSGGNPYAPYEGELPDYDFLRPVFKHQEEMVSHGLTRRRGIFACEMGTGKTLAWLEIIERIEPDLQDNEIWYVGPKSGVVAVNREIRKWRCQKKPLMLTYEGLVKRMKYVNREIENPPRMICFDESSKLKTPTSQRSNAGLAVANWMREYWGTDCYIILMSGTPAPKTPADWWHQCEVACPGFIKEGNVHKFKNRLCVIEERQSITGGVYPHVVTWLDDVCKCSSCGQLGCVDMEHSRSSVNEVEYLYKRMGGLVLVKFKKDCLDLPEKQYQTIRIKPSASILRAAKLITTTSRRTIEALTLLRELSDGFQYRDEVVGTELCPNCKGNKRVSVKKLKDEADLNIMAPQHIKETDFDMVEVECDLCRGEGKINKLARMTEVLGDCPKDQVFLDELDAHEEVGRYIVWGGFTGTIDRLVEMAQSQGWAVLRVDGRGYVGFNTDGMLIEYEVLLDCMDGSAPDKVELMEKYPKVCFIGHPQAGGMALTLTSSPTSLFFSNCFSGEARMQAEDRGHRPGMNVDWGHTIKDIIHLAVDQLVIDNLKKKKRLQDISMGQLADSFGQKVELSER